MFLEKAKQLVRQHPANKDLMELSFGCEVEIDRGEDKVLIQVNYDKLVKKREATDDWKVTKILGKPAHLEHYLRVLESVENKGVDYAITHGGRLISAKTHGATKDYWDDTTVMVFNLTTGKPATEKDAEEFIKLVADE